MEKYNLIDKNIILYAVNRKFLFMQCAVMVRLVKTALKNVGNVKEKNNVIMLTERVSMDVTLDTKESRAQKVVRVKLI